MGELRLYAIGIDEVRDLFTGSPEAAQAVRTAALDRFPPPPAPARRTGLLGKLGPLFRQPLDAPVIRPDVPTEADVTSLVSGRFIPPERTTAAWALVEAWLAATSWGSLIRQVSEKQVNDLEFDLARAGMPSTFGLRKLFTDSLAIPLRDNPGLVTGFVRHSRIADWVAAWSAATPSLFEANAGLASEIVAWLEQFDAWSVQAQAAGRPTPDLVAMYDTILDPAR